MILEKQERYFVLQWHVTAKCDQKCRHCYLLDKSYKSELENELSFKDCQKVIDDLARTVNAWGVKGRISFSGGDPLLRKDFLELVKYARDHEIDIVILGNPYHINEITARKIKELGVSRYQISIDGMKKIHDFFRKKGSFKDSVRAIKVLKKAGVKTAVMFTLSNSNKSELIKVIRLVSKLGVDEFDFSRFVPIGSNKDFSSIISNQEYHKLLLQVLKKYSRLEKKGCPTKFGRKESLWKLICFEKNILGNLPCDHSTVFGGCSLAIRGLCILADGTVYGCRRLPVKIGKVPKQSVRDIFVKSPFLNKARKLENFKRCKKCSLVQYCRGCPAVAYSISGNPFSKDPSCWAVVKELKGGNVRK
jgi:radical SAM/SPASM domain protein of ACGX system